MPTVRASPGAADANSYLTVDEGDELASEHLYSDAWAAASVAEREAAIIQATRLVDGECFRGAPANTTQALAFPRSGLVGASGNPLATDTIPRELLHATFEMALVLLSAHQAGTNPTADLDQKVQGLAGLKAGPVELKFQAWESSTGYVMPDRVVRMLVRSWLCDPNQKRLMFGAV